jgi:hypothetical protein
LVRIADFAEKRAQNAEFEGVFRRLEKWALQSVARDILKGAGRDWRRLCNCCRALVSKFGGVSVMRSVKGEGRAYYAGLQHCGSPWVCMICGGKIVEFRRSEVERGILKLGEVGGSAAFLTLTFSHGREDDLKDLFKRQAAALRHFTDSGTWKRLKGEGLIGTIRGKELTVGEATGWHPHTHTIVCFDTPAIPDDLENALWPVWSAALGKVGLSARRAAYGKSVGLSVEPTYGAVADYVLKNGCEPSKRPWGPEDDLTRGISKSARSSSRFSSPDLLRAYAATGESRYFRWYREYAAATRGSSPLRWSPGFRSVLLPAEAERSDDEVAGGVDEEAAFLGNLPLSVWRLVLGADRRGELLEVANRGGWDAVVDYVKSL